MSWNPTHTPECPGSDKPALEALIIPRARDLGLTIGRFPPGPLNAITDVGQVTVGHVTLNEGARTEVGHFDFLEQGGFDVFINVVDGDVYIDAGGTWLRVVE